MYLVIFAVLPRRTPRVAPRNARLCGKPIQSSPLNEKGLTERKKKKKKHINSTDPLLPPIIDPKYFSNKFGKPTVFFTLSPSAVFQSPFPDTAFHAITTAWLRQWMHAEPISELLINENAPGTDSVNTFEEWAAYARSNAVVSFASSPPSPTLQSTFRSLTLHAPPPPPQSTFHPIGTAALAPEYLRGASVAFFFGLHSLRTERLILGVVSPDFKVHRTANMRVVDASIIPLTFSVAPLATVYALAEKVCSSISYLARSRCEYSVRC
jgi:hypothetical protein